MMRWLSAGNNSTEAGRGLALLEEICKSLTGNSGFIAGINWFYVRKLWLNGKMVWLSAGNNDTESAW
jgi:hypothetical protein